MDSLWKAADSHFSNGRVLVGGFCAEEKKKKKTTWLAFSQVHEDYVLWRLWFSYTGQRADVSKSVMQFLQWMSQPEENDMVRYTDGIYGCVRLLVSV